MQRKHRTFAACWLLALFVAGLTSAPGQAQLVKVCSMTSCDWVDYASLNLIDLQTLGIQSDAVAQVLLEVTRATNLPPNFKLRRTEGLNNAAAKVVHHPNGMVRIIEYDPFLFDRWVVIAEKSIEFVMAHEVGHHVSNHTFYIEDNTMEVNHRRELEADYFAGGVLARLGVRRDQASQAVNVLNASDSFSHPGRERRRVKVEEGWDNAAPAQSGGGSRPSYAPASASVENVWVDHNVFDGNRKGMRVHTAFEVNNLKGREIRVVAYFYQREGEALKDLDGSYNTVDGKVSFGESATPSYDGSVWSDFKLFMPYDQLHVLPGSGVNRLKFYIIVWDMSGAGAAELARSDWTYFTYTAPAAPASSADIENVSVEHNVLEYSLKGMRIHTRFEVKNLQGKDIRVVAYFSFRDGKALKDFDGIYKTVGGEVSVGESSTATFEVSRWEDFKLFMPYDQLHMLEGTHELMFEVIVWDMSAAEAVELARSEGVSFRYSK